MRKLIVVLMAAVSLSAADLDNNTLTVTATRPLNAPPDEASMVVQVSVAPDIGLDDVLAMMKGTGITAGNLTGVYETAVQTGQPYVEIGRTATWTFQTAISLSDLQSTIATLTQLQKSSGSKLSFDIFGSRASALPACPLTALVADARRQADAMASAAGMKVGPIVSVSDTPSAGAYGTPVGVFDPGVVYFSGVFSMAITTTLSGILTSTVVSTPPPSCSLTVQFKLQ